MASFSWPNTSGGSVTFPILAPSGSVSAPSYSFSSSQNTGMYLDVSLNLDFTVQGTQILSLTPSGPVFIGQMSGPAGSAATPTYSFTGNGNCGMYEASGILHFSTNGTSAVAVDLSQNWVFAGSATAPSFIPNSSTIPANGIFLPAANTVGIAANSVQIATYANGNGDSVQNLIAALNKTARSYCTLNASSTSGDAYSIYQQSGGIKWSVGMSLVNTSGGFAIANTDGFGSAIYLSISTAGLVTVNTGPFSVGTAGKGLQVKEGSNAKQGTVTLVAGAAVVANTSVTASSRIFLTAQSLGTVTAPKALAVTARTAGTSFTITSADATDTSVVAYEIFEPA